MRSRRDRDWTRCSQDAGGLREPVRAFLVGGYAGSWVDAADAAAVCACPRASLRPLRRLARRGDRRGPAPTAPARWPRSRASQAGWPTRARGQCGPCVNGLASIADTLAERVRRPSPAATRSGDILRWSRAGHRPRRVRAPRRHRALRHQRAARLRRGVRRPRPPRPAATPASGGPSSSPPASAARRHEPADRGGPDQSVRPTGCAPSCCRSASRSTSGDIR